MTALAGRRVLVTGGSSGIGAATAVALSAAGARVAIAARDERALGVVAAGLRDPLVLRCDVRDPAAVDATVRAAVEAFGGLDVVVTAAGLGRFGETASFPVADWDAVLAVGLRGTFLVVRAALPHLRRSRGHLVTLCSVAAERAFPGAAAYSASKAGVRALADVVRAEERRSGVRVTDLIVGAVDSPFWERAGGTTLPRDRMLRPDDVARAILRAVSEPPTSSLDEIVLLPADGVL